MRRDTIGYLSERLRSVRNLAATGAHARSMSTNSLRDIGRNAHESDTHTTRV